MLKESQKLQNTDFLSLLDKVILLIYVLQYISKRKLYLVHSSSNTLELLVCTLKISVWQKQDILLHQVQTQLDQDLKRNLSA